MLGKRGDPARTQCANGRIGEQNVVGHFAHDLRFVRRRAGDTNRTALELLGGEPWRFVRLDMRAQRESMLGCITSRTIEVAVEAIEVHDRDGGLELGKEFGHGK